MQQWEAYVVGLWHVEEKARHETTLEAAMGAHNADVHRLIAAIAASDAKAKELQRLSREAHAKELAEAKALAIEAEEEQQRSAVLKVHLALHRMQATVGIWRHRLMSRAMQQWEAYVLGSWHAEEKARHAGVMADAKDAHSLDLHKERHRLMAAIAASDAKAKELRRLSSEAHENELEETKVGHDAAMEDAKSSHLDNLHGERASMNASLAAA